MPRGRSILLRRNARIARRTQTDTIRRTRESRVNRSIALTIFLLVSSLALVTWWTWFQVGEAERLERAGQHMLAGHIDMAAQELGAEDAAKLPDLGRSRRRMFLSEGLVFIVKEAPVSCFQNLPSRMNIFFLSFSG